MWPAACFLTFALCTVCAGGGEREPRQWVDVDAKRFSAAAGPQRAHGDGRPGDAAEPPALPPWAGECLQSLKHMAAAVLHAAGAPGHHQHNRQPSDSLLRDTPPPNYELTGTLSLDADALVSLRRLLSLAEANATATRIYDAFGVMVQMAHSLQPSAPPEPLLRRVCHSAAELLPLANLAVLAPAALHLLYGLWRARLRLLGVSAVMAVFWASVVWNWLFLVKDREASLAADRDDVEYARCMETGPAGRHTSILDWLVASIAFGADERCVRIIKAHHTEALWSVTPMHALAHTVTSVFVEPLHHVLHTTVTAVTRVAGRLPVVYQPLFIAFCSVGFPLFLLALFAIWRGYGIGFFGARLGPVRAGEPLAPPSSSRHDRTPVHETDCCASAAAVGQPRQGRQQPCAGANARRQPARRQPKRHAIGWTGHVRQLRQQTSD